MEKAMLAASLPVAQDLGISNLLLTCDDNNVGSLKTIETCSGRLENTVLTGKDQPMKRRYWIKIQIEQNPFVAEVLKV
jgi:predicted acetyltransferase